MERISGEKAQEHIKLGGGLVEVIVEAGDLTGQSKARKWPRRAAGEASSAPLAAAGWVTTTRQKKIEGSVVCIHEGPLRTV